jgi:hypothetical protein
MKRPSLLHLLILPILASAACSPRLDKPAGRDGWLQGDQHQKFETVTKQLRGFDMAMVETGYRYQELYWAGQDENWEYASYQADKIKVAIEYGLERRPKRAKSSEDLLQTAIPQIKEAISTQDKVVFDSSFSALTISCNACHDKEKVPFFKVEKPVSRQSPIRN